MVIPCLLASCLGTPSNYTEVFDSGVVMEYVRGMLWCVRWGMLQEVSVM